MTTAQKLKDMRNKSIDAVMAAQTDLVEVVTELRQIVCVKG